jgi:hypothetical protein
MWIPLILTCDLFVYCRLRKRRPKRNQRPRKLRRQRGTGSWWMETNPSGQESKFILLMRYEWRGAYKNLVTMLYSFEKINFFCKDTLELPGIFCDVIPCVWWHHIMHLIYIYTVLTWFYYWFLNCGQSILKPKFIFLEIGARYAKMQPWFLHQSIEGTPIFQIMSLPQFQQDWHLPDSCTHPIKSTSYPDVMVFLHFPKTCGIISLVTLLWLTSLLNEAF